jgi:hypothetical protein
VETLETLPVPAAVFGDMKDDMKDEAEGGATPLGALARFS